MKICIVGAFGFENLDIATGGQPVKTRELYDVLCNKYSKKNVSFVETYRWKKNFVRMLVQLLTYVRKSDIIIMLPAHNGVIIFSKLLLILKRKKAKVFYDVIGGWLPEKVQTEVALKKCLKKFDGIWVETSSMQKALGDQGLNNISIVPNFKNLNILKENELTYHNVIPFKLCTFSRVMKQKGIEDAINGVRTLNLKYNKTIYTLDIYGQIDDGYRENFESMQKEFPEYISYKGVASPNESVGVLKEYFALLFPTHYYTEGVPGTIIDSYSAGTPIITSLWVNSGDVFEENETGFGYEFNNYKDFLKKLENAYLQAEEFSKMKKNCLLWAKKYQAETVVEQIDGLLKNSKQGIYGF